MRYDAAFMPLLEKEGQGLILRSEERCVVGVRVLGGAIVKAFDVCIKDEDVYVNYSDSRLWGIRSS
jgi:hypothetical protein